MRKFSKNLVLAALAASALATALPVMAICGIGQDDSTCGTSYTARRLVKTYAQEDQILPAPIVITNAPVIQVVQPNTYQRSGYGSGWNAAGATANCDTGGTLLGGGGSCTNRLGLVSVAASQPSGNGWYISCGAGFQDATVNATAYAVCSAP